MHRLTPYQPLLSMLLVTATVAGAVHADTLTVPGDYGTVADAVASANSGDTIVVGAGTHVVIDVDFGGKELILEGSGAGVSILDAQQLGRHFLFENGETSASIVRGFTLTNGLATSGGSIRINGASPTIDSCVFDGNGTRSVSSGNGGLGGALHLRFSGSLITDCEFTNNAAADGVTPNSGTGARGGHGGGIASEESSATIARCTFNGNTVGNGSSGAASGGQGGAGGRGSAIWLANLDPSPAFCTVLDCVFENGTSGFGGPGVDAPDGASGNGGLVFARVGSNDELRIDRCVVRNGVAAGGSAPGLGGGLFLRVDDYGDSVGAISVTNCAVFDYSADNASSGGGIYALINASSIEVLHSVIAGNSAGSAGAAGTDDPGLVLRNTIVWDCGASPLSGVGADYCVVEGGYPGTFNLDVDPQLDVDRVHLLDGSPCVDSGSPSLEGLPFEDIDGDPRGTFGLPDIGADERTSLLSVPGPYANLTIRDAIEAAPSGARIVVAAGTYEEHGLSFMGKDLELVSEAGPDQTTIDAEGAGRHFVFSGGEGPSALIEGFRLLGGDPTSGAGGSIQIRNAAPTLRGLVFEENVVRSPAAYGGALSIVNSGMPDVCLVEDCTFRFNSTIQESFGQELNGGAVWIDDASISIRDCAFEFNQASDVLVSPFGLVLDDPGVGGALYVTGLVDVEVIDCVFEGNSAGNASNPDQPEPPFYSGDGGAIYLDVMGGDVAIERCLFVENTAGVFQGNTGEVYGDGGAIYSDGSGLIRITVQSSAFLGGRARRGAAACLSGGGPGGSFDFVNCTFRDGVVDDTATAIFSASSVVDVRNCILWSGTAQAPINNGGGLVDVTYSNLSTVYPGIGNLSLPPNFSSGYSLNPTSPCVDAGDPDTANLPSFDLDGDPLGCSPVDMGADELGLEAEQVVRAGSIWPNPVALLLGSSAPIQGTIWDPRIDHSAFAPSAILDFLAIGFISTELPFGAGSLLLDPGALLPVQFAAPGESFQVPIPSTCGLTGASLFTQGGSFGGEIELANGIDLVIGDH